MALNSFRCAFTLFTSTSGAARVSAVGAARVSAAGTEPAAAAGSVPQPSTTASEKPATANLRFTLSPPGGGCGVSHTGLTWHEHVGVARRLTVMVEPVNGVDAR